jgi:photosystem II stability/assembly factor-like uncharacterized protein
MNAADCVASNGQSIILTRDGGTRWTVVATPPSSLASNPARVVTCPTSQECIVVTGGLEALNRSGTKARLLTAVTWTTDNGLSWTSRSAKGVQAGPGALGCWSATDCLLSGDLVDDPFSFGPSLYRTTDRGIHWRRLPVPGGQYGFGLLQLQCVAPRECLATTGSSVIRSTNGGESWKTLLRVSGDSDLRVLSCFNAQNCVAGGFADWPTGESAALWTTHDGGRTWTIHPFPLMPVPRGLQPCVPFVKTCR